MTILRSRKEEPLKLSSVAEVPRGSRWPGRSIPQVFDEVVSRLPNHTAIRGNEAHVSYAELDARAGAITHALKALGGDSPRQIALLFEKGPAAVAALYAVLKAGHIYVPLDPTDPASRIEFILQDSHASAILTHSAHLEQARTLAGSHCSVLNVDDVASDATSRFQGPNISPDAVAYLYYTSGSTGQPKGVMQTHRNLLHFVGTYSEKLRIASEDRVSLLFSLSFSAANTNLHGAILNGATLCPYDVRRQGAAGLPLWIENEGITVIHTVPTLFRHLLEHVSADKRFGKVRSIDMGGEPAFESDARLFRAHFNSECVLVNHFAATEASVIAQYVVEGNRDGREGALSVGRAASGVEVRIIGEDGKDAPPDQPGEIVLSSPFLSPGYWGRPDLTSAVFSDDAGRAGWRIYRSGDRGKMSAEGLLFPLGRKDDRVKIRGHSVALPEVETALRDLEGVREAVVVAVENEKNPDAGKQLAAYVVAGDAKIKGLRHKLFSKIPSYMMPSEINVVESLPRTATGKIDRRVLTGPDRPRQPQARDAEPPADDVERAIAAIYAKLLELSEVGRNEDFFELGGNSLKIADLQVEIQRALSEELSLADFLKNATVAGVAETLRRKASEVHSATAASPVLVPLRESGSQPILFLVHGALAQAFVSPSFLEALGDDQPLYGFQARGLDGKDRPNVRIPVIAADYVSAMRKVQPKGPYHLGAICSGSIVAHEMACQLREAGETLFPLLLIDPPLPPGEKNLRTRFKMLAQLYGTRLPIQPKGSRKVVRKINTRLRTKNFQGRIVAPAEDRTRREAADRAAVNFKIALQWHKPRLYDGSVHVIASRKRLDSDWKSGVWKSHIAGEILFLEAALKHAEILDPSNEVFVVQLRRHLDLVRNALPRSS